MTHPALRSLRVPLLLAATACSSSTTTATSTTATDGGTTTAAGDGGVTTTADGGVTATGLHDLTTCTTSIAADAPAFYKKFFKCVTVTTTADGVNVAYNGLPPHKSYYYGQGNVNFADFDTSRGPTYKPNPNKIVGRTRTVSVPSAPVSRGLTITPAMVDRKAGTNPNEYRMGAAGVAIDSVVIFNDQAAGQDNIDDERFTFDSYDAHPAPSGEYHYHTTSPGPLEVLKALGFATTTKPGDAEVELYGVMCDGALVLGCTELDGKAPDGATLDGQNGHVTDIVDKDGVTHFTGRYHTHVCPKLFTTHKYTPEIQFYSTCTVK